MIELTTEQTEDMARAGNVAVRVRHPETREVFVLIRESAFESLKGLIDGSDYNPGEGAAWINEIMAEDDADDPLLESYQKYARSE